MVLQEYGEEESVHREKQDHLPDTIKDYMMMMIVGLDVVA